MSEMEPEERLTPHSGDGDTETRKPTPPPAELPASTPVPDPESEVKIAPEEANDVTEKPLSDATENTDTLVLTSVKDTHAYDLLTNTCTSISEQSRPKDVLYDSDEGINTSTIGSTTMTASVTQR